MHDEQQVMQEPSLEELRGDGVVLELGTRATRHPDTLLFPCSARRSARFTAAA